MPELPDITTYIDALDRFVKGRVILGVKVRSPFLLRTYDPKPDAIVGRTVLGFDRMGKRIVWELDEELFLVFHLMVAGRFHWRKPQTLPTRKVDLAAFGFDAGTLLLTEVSTQKAASLHIVRGRAAAVDLNPGGLEVLTARLEDFQIAITSENRTLKRILTDPHILSGIGNAYSDEILHAAQLSPIKLTQSLKPDEIERLYHAVQTVLAAWILKLRAQTGDKFPEKVTAFHPDMAMHGKYGTPCPTCGTLIQRIVYASNETNYCPRCQTDGKVLADRALSKLLKGDWPRTIDELEARRAKNAP